MNFILRIFFAILSCYLCFEILLYINVKPKLNLSIFDAKIGQPILKNRSPNAKIFCMILTSNDSIRERGKAVYETWAQKCDSFKLILKTSRPEEYAIIPSENILSPPGLLSDTYEQLTDKIFFTFKHVHKEYPNFDWFLKADDDTFIFMDNMRKFLRDKNSSLPVTFGYDFKVNVPQGYHSGGASYLLSREAFSRIGKKLVDDFEYCPNRGVEDVDVASCLRKLDVYPNKSIDKLGRERFHPFDIATHLNGNFPDWFYSYAANPLQITIFKGLNCCSDSTVSFHYMDPKLIYKTNSYLKTLHDGKRFKFKDLVKFVGK